MAFDRPSVDQARSAGARSPARRSRTPRRRARSSPASSTRSVASTARRRAARRPVARSSTTRRPTPGRRSRTCRRASPTPAWPPMGPTSSTPAATSRTRPRPGRSSAPARSGATRPPRTPTRRCRCSRSNARGGQLVVLGGELHYFGGTNLARTQDVGDHYVLALSGGRRGRPRPRSRTHATTWAQRCSTASSTPSAASTAMTTRSSRRPTSMPTTPPRTPGRSAPACPRPVATSPARPSVLGGRIVVAGGETSHGAGIAAVTAYDPALNAWTALTALPAARVSGVAGVIAGDLYYTTGSGTATTYKGVPGATDPDPPLAARRASRRPALRRASRSTGPTTPRPTWPATTSIAARAPLAPSRRSTPPWSPARPTPTSTRRPASTRSTGSPPSTTRRTSRWCPTRPAPPAPRAVIRINTGGPAQTVGGVAWSACTSLTACSGYVTGGFPFAQSPVPTITGMVSPGQPGRLPDRVDRRTDQRRPGRRRGLHLRRPGDQRDLPGPAPLRRAQQERCRAARLRRQHRGRRQRADRLRRLDAGRRHQQGHRPRVHDHRDRRDALRSSSSARSRTPRSRASRSCRSPPT